MNLAQPKMSAVTNQAEVHFSAASLYLNLSLFKVQPPDEYKDIGRSISARRKTEADEGQSHRTAVELGYLFGGIVPKVPNLFRAYGLRCSELANSSTFNPKGSSQHGLFANEVGLDGTSVWAAATSGDAAIAVLLLACMLSRMWDPPEAISIWMQLIAERKKVLMDSGNPLEMFACREGSLTRESIAAWHTSTHAWRLTADEANARRQNQLLLIINNLGIPVNTKVSLSDSVISAWQTAMITVDQFVSGNPQSVQTGAPLLGLAAWHLYPDMVVFCQGNHGKPIDVRQKDPLIQTGGVMTLGLQDMRRLGDGLHWSLPLAHLRHYGRPVQSEAILCSKTSRTSMDDLILVALGSLIRRWCAHSADPNEIELALKVLVQMDEYTDIPVQFRQEVSWVSLLASAAAHYLSSEASLKAEKLPLIRCGQRRYPLFIDDPTSGSIFGLSDPRTFLRLFPGNAGRVEFLRHVAKDFSDYRYLMVIQCKSGNSNSIWELSSVEPGQGNHRRTYDEMEGTTPSKPKYVRWLNKAYSDISPADIQPDAKIVRIAQHIPCFWAPLGFQWQNAPPEFYTVILGQATSETNWRHSHSVHVSTRLAFGDPNVAALYCIDISYWFQSPNQTLKSLRYNQYRYLPNICVSKHVSWAFERGLPSREAMFAHLQEGKFSANMNRSLHALLTASRLYKGLSNATVDLRVASRALYKHSWIPPQDKTRHYPFAGFSLTQEEKFACIARFESGSFNIHPSAMAGVLAISSGNSIYVARCLLQDPCGHESSTAIERVVGNLGKTGMAFLICPEVPDVRPECDDPHLVLHNPFDGEEEDCFHQTSLQLSFTGFEQPVDVGSRGNRDVEASYVEAAIQLYDRGQWVADLNILNIFKHNFSRIMTRCIQRHEDHSIREELCKFVSIDSWEELLDSPIEVGVIRARGNWQARLAAAALAIQRGHETRIVPDKVCWPCYLALERLPRRPTHPEDDDQYPEEEAFGALPQDFREENESDSETEEMIQAAIRRDEKRVPQIGEHEKDDDGVSVEVSARNVVYVL
jgi:hypothetical protein